MKRTPYDPPRLSSLGTVLEAIEQRGEELAVRLAGGFFELPPELRETVLGIIVSGLRRHGARRELALYDARDGRRVGAMSEESGLRLDGRSGLRPWRASS